MKGISMFTGAGMLLLAAALMLDEAGWIPHGAKLFLMGLACALELWGVHRKCRKSEEEQP